MLIIDKPAGLAVHAGPSRAPDLESLLPSLRFERRDVPRLAHRLDRDTSGCLVLARHRRAARRLGELFSGGAVEKTYWAIVIGAPAEPQGRLSLPLKKITRKSGWRMEARADGQTAITDYRVLASADGFALLELRPQTGRTHQVRVHCAALGCPVAGDPLYNPETTSSGPLQLHARMVVLPYQPGRVIKAVATPPAHMRALLNRLGIDAETPGGPGG